MNCTELQLSNSKGSSLWEIAILIIFFTTNKIKPFFRLQLSINYLHYPPYFIMSVLCISEEFGLCMDIMKYSKIEVFDKG